jgi:biopolymer transport protein ExbD
MKKRQRKGLGEKAQLEMTPMIDVVFQLLIFFVVTIKQEDLLSHLDVTRPSAPQEEKQPDQDLLQITVYKQGFVLQGRPVNLKELDRQLTRISSYSKSVSVVIKCTGDSPHAFLVQLLDVCSKAELKNLNLFSI